MLTVVSFVTKILQVKRSYTKINQTWNSYISINFCTVCIVLYKFWSCGASYWIGKHSLSDIFSLTTEHIYDRIGTRKITNLAASFVTSAHSHFGSSSSPNSPSCSLFCMLRSTCMHLCSHIHMYYELHSTDEGEQKALAPKEYFDKFDFIKLNIPHFEITVSTIKETNQSWRKIFINNTKKDF